MEVKVPNKCFHTKDGSGFVAAVKRELGIWMILSVVVAVSKYVSYCEIKKRTNNHTWKSWNLSCLQHPTTYLFQKKYGNLPKARSLTVQKT